MAVGRIRGIFHGMRTLPRRAAVFGVCLLVLAALALSAPRAEDEDRVRLYTNADLERFPALPDSSVVAGQPSAEEWRFVTEYIDRQYERLDADRSHLLERERTEAESEWIRHRAGRRSYGLPLYWGHYPARPRVPRAEDGRDRGERILRTLGPDASIRPLHARPTRAQLDRFRASFRSGADAVPGQGRNDQAGSPRR